MYSVDMADDLAALRRRGETVIDDYAEQPMLAHGKGMSGQNQRHFFQ